MLVSRFTNILMGRQTHEKTGNNSPAWSTREGNNASLLLI